MPKLKISEEKLRERRLQALIKSQMVIHGVSCKKVQGYAGFKVATYYNRMRDPLSYTLKELFNLSGPLHLEVKIQAKEDSRL